VLLPTLLHWSWARFKSMQLVLKCPGSLQQEHIRSSFLKVFISLLFVSCSVCYLFLHPSVIWLSMLHDNHLCFCRPFPCLPLCQPPSPPQPGYPPKEYLAAQLDAFLISFVSVVCSACLLIASIHYWAVGVVIHCWRIWMVVSYESDRVLEIHISMASLVIFSVVPISFL